MQNSVLLTYKILTNNRPYTCITCTDASFMHIFEELLKHFGSLSFFHWHDEREKLFKT